MKQIFHPYNIWEEYQFGMWKHINGTKKTTLLKEAIEFTGDYRKYGSYMLRVVKEWIYSCEVNLTNPSINKRAWVGHCACCLAIQSPEHVTREAWSHLTENQQNLANNQADIAIDCWENNYIKGEIICQKDQLELMF